MSAYPISATPARHRRARLLAGCALAAALTTPAFGQQAFEATPTIVSGGANITQGIPITGGLRDRVTVNNPQVVIDWTPTDDATGGGPITILRAGNELQFQNNGDIGVGQYTVLNRIIPDDPSRAVQFDGHVMSQIDTGYGATTGGNIWFYSPGGIIAGATSRFDVGSLVLSANDIDTSGGLFGDDSNSSLAGTIRFRGDANSRSAVTIMPGAQINASGNYVALVAPRISQGGSINVEGGAALVAAESADITIPISGGLFDIAVQTGSSVDAGGETTLTHSGTTETRDVDQTGAARRVYLVAVPKNDAVTMLVSGSLGYAPAVQAQLAANGAIYLTTGDTVSSDTPAVGSEGAIHVTGGDFGGRTVASADSITIDTSTAALNFATDLQALTNSGNIVLSAQNGRNLTAGGGILLRHENPDLNGQSSISASASQGSTLQAQSLSLESDSFGTNDFGYGAVDGKSGTVAIAATSGGIITIADDISVSSIGRGGQGSSSNGGDGFGGTVTVSATGGRISASGLYVDAEGQGGDTGYGDLGGSGVGGSVAITATNGELDFGQVAVSADGFGGYSDFGRGGSGTGGSATLLLTGGTLDAGGVSIDVDGIGSDGSSGSGAGQGGVISIANNVSSSFFAGNGVDLSATGRAGSAFSASPILGGGTGGTITVVTDASSFSTGEGSLDAIADGMGGFSDTYNPTIGRGGTISVTMNAADPNNVESSFSANGIYLSADGSTLELQEERQFVPYGNSGTGVGGSVTLDLTGGPTFASEISLSASGTGGSGDHGMQAGAGFAGRAELALNGGSLEAGSVSILAEATGGDGAFGESGYGGAGAGGTAGIGANPFGAGSGAYLTGTGGMLSAETVQLSADTTGGYGGDGQAFGSEPVDAASGGAAAGGTAQVVTNGVDFSVGQLSVSAEGTGGDGGTVDYANAFFEGAETANAGSGGAGAGGSATVGITGGSHSLGGVNADASGYGGYAGLVLAAGEGGFDPMATGRGGDGGNGSGGSASIIFTSATVGDQAQLTADASAFGSSGGSGAQGGDGGAGTGGSALIRLDGGTADLYAIRAYAYADGGSGGFANLLDGGNGGAAQGGDARFEARNGAVVNVADDGQFDPFDLDASVFGGSGGSGGSFAASDFGGSGGAGGSAFGGSATVLIQSGAQATIPGMGGVENRPPALIVSADAGSGGDGGTGSGTDSGGAGGDGGSAVAGLATIDIQGGNAAFGDVYAEATAERGIGGSAGFDAPTQLRDVSAMAAAGNDGSGFGGRLVLKVTDASGQAGTFRAGNFSTDLGGSDVDGSLFIGDTGTAATGGIHLGSFYSVSFKNALNESESSSDYDIQSSARTIAVDGDVDLTANGDIRFAFQGTGGIASGTSLDIRSRTRGISITNGSPSANLAASLDAPSISLRTTNGNIVAGPGTLLASSGSIDVSALFGNVEVANARANDGISIRAGESEGPLPFDTTVTGTVTSNGGITIAAGRDTTIAAGAQVIADQAVTIASGDDIVIGSGALVRAANNPPPETGYGATDPLEQSSQLRLLAGGLDTGEEGNVASILIDGTLEAPNRTLFMSAGAVQAGSETQLTAGNLYVRLNDIPVGDQVPSDDSRQLTGACLQGSVCLGTANVNGIVRIGEAEYEPINLRLNGGIDGTDVLLRARSVELGQAGVSNIIRASDSLTIESLGENLTLEGPLTITGGSDVTRVASFRSIDGAAAQVNAPGTLDLYAGNGITLAGLSATTIRTVDFDGNVVNDGGITAPGTIAVGRIVSGSALDLSAGGDIALDSFAVTGGTMLTAANGTITVLTDASATEGVAATAKAVTLNGLTGLHVTTARAQGALSLTSKSDLSFGALDAGSVAIVSQGDAVGNEIAAFGAKVDAGGRFEAARIIGISGVVDITADHGIQIGTLGSTDRPTSIDLRADHGSVSVTGGELGTFSNPFTGSFNATGEEVDLNLFGDLAVSNVTATAGQIVLSSEINGRISARRLTASGDVRITQRGLGFGGITADTINAGGAVVFSTPDFVKVTSDLIAGSGLTVSAPSIDITAQDGLNVLQADATAGDLKLTTVSGTLSAGNSSATGGITLISGGDVIADTLESGYGTVVSGAQAVTIGSIASGGDVALTSSNGSITVSTDLNAAGPVHASGRSVDLTAQDNLALAEGSATAGDLRLTSANGGIAIGNASATGTLTANAANGLIAVDGDVSGSTVALTSRDIAIGSEAQLGSSTQTMALTLTSTADRLFVGDAPEGSGYRLDSDELTRIASAGDITIASEPGGATGAAFDFADPADANVVLGALTFDGSQLGSNGTLLISSPRAIGVVGNMGFRNVQSGQTVTLRSASDIALAAESGLVTLKDASGGLSGTLRLEAQQVQALSTKARSEIPGLDLNAVRQRLGTNDQLENDGGYFQAGQIVVRISRLAFIQNSGANSDDPNAKRGFTANSFRIETSGEQPAQLVLNGRVGNVTGAGLIDAVNVSGSFDTGSSFNGCTPGALCGAVAPPPPPGPGPEIFAPVLSVSRDQIEDDKKQDEKEESLQASQTRPDPLIQILNVPTSRFDPLIDQPVTGAGNEDLWMTPMSSPQGQ